MSEFFLLSEAQMARISLYFSLPHGVPRVDNRRVVSGIIYVLRPVAQADRHDLPSLTRHGDNVVIGAEGPIGQPVDTQVLPDVLDRIEFWRLRRQERQRDVPGDLELLRDMPSRLIEDEDRVVTVVDLGLISARYVFSRYVFSWPRYRTTAFSVRPPCPWVGKMALKIAVQPIQIFPGSRWENGYNERFNGMLR